MLLLPAFSTVSSREEMRPLAERLAAQGCRCTLVDWPGFGDSTRGRLSYGPRLYHHFLADFMAAAPHFSCYSHASPVPILVICGNATPPKSKAEMAVLAERSGVDLRWVPGSLGLHEEYAQAMADPIIRFVDALPTEPTGRARRVTQ